MSDELVSCVQDIVEDPPDVLIVGSGPAGVAVAERLYERPEIRMAILERGGILTLTHINNVFPNRRRRDFIEAFKESAWEGDFKDGGLLLPALGGRGIASGAHLRRFDDDDYLLWEDGHWPQDVIRDLPKYYFEAEFNRRVSLTAIRGPAQVWARGTLGEFKAYPPPVGVDLWSSGGFDVGRGYDSSVARLWRLVLEDSLEHGRPRRLRISTNNLAIGIKCENSKAVAVTCLDTLRPSHSPVQLSPLAYSSYRN